MSEPFHEPRGHDHPEYTERLQAGETWWRRVVLQLPYRLHLRRLVEGPTLDVGCGIGRNLAHLPPGSVGVDSNPDSIRVAAGKGLTTLTVTDFPESAHARPLSYRSLLFSHVLEHMTNSEAGALVSRYIPYLERQGRVIVIVPQEAGYRSDPTHVEPVDRAALTRIAEENELILERIYSFPFPRPMGRVFPHNETVALMRPPAIPG